MMSLIRIRAVYPHPPASTTPPSLTNLHPDTSLARTTQALSIRRSTHLSTPPPHFVLVPSGLLPTLRPYQRRAVAWMLSRERRGSGADPDPDLDPTGSLVRRPLLASGAHHNNDLRHDNDDDGSLHPLWRRLPSPKGAGLSTRDAALDAGSGCGSRSGASAAAVYVNPYSGLLSLEVRHWDRARGLPCSLT